MKEPQKRIILRYLKWMYDSGINQGWVKAYELRGKRSPYGFMGHQADRRARELAQDGYVEHRINEGYAEYRYKYRFIPQVSQEERDKQLLIQGYR